MVRKIAIPVLLAAIALAGCTSTGSATPSTSSTTTPTFSIRSDFRMSPAAFLSICEGGSRYLQAHPGSSLVPGVSKSEVANFRKAWSRFTAASAQGPQARASAKSVYTAACVKFILSQR